MDLPVEYTGTPLSEPGTGGVLRVGQIGRLLQRQAWLVVGLAVVGGAAAYGYALTLPKSYTSSAALAVVGDSFSIPELQGALRGSNAPDPMPLVRTELQALTSPAMVQQVVTQLDLVSNPEFNPALRPPTLSERLKSALGQLIPRLRPAPSDPNEAAMIAATHALSSFQDNRSLVINVSFTAQDPALAARFINTLVADYFAARSRWREAANQGANSDMTQRITQARNDLSAIEQKMRDLRSQSGAVGLIRTGSVGQQQLEELATAADRASLDRAAAEANYQRAAALAKSGDSAALANVLDSTTISRLREQEGEAASKAAALSSTHGDNYPGVVSARSNLAAIRGQMAAETQRIVASLNAQLQVARAHEADVKRQLEDARTAAVSAQNIQAQLNELQADANSERQVYQQLLVQSQHTTGATGKSAKEMPDVRVISDAVPSAYPSAPNMRMAGGLGLVGGALLGCLLAFVRVQREDGFSDPDALAAIGGLPVTISLPRTGRGGLLKRVAAGPGGVEAEALRLLRVRLRSLPHAPRSVTFTAIGEDPAMFASAFARVVASDGELVLLAEGNLGDPSVGQLLDVPDGAFDRALRGEEDWRDATRADPDSPLDVLTSNEAADDGHMLLTGVALQNLLMEARDDYSLIVFSGAAADDAATRTLAQRTDATILVVNARRARRADVREQSERLATLSHNPVVGVLVTQA